MSPDLWATSEQGHTDLASAKEAGDVRPRKWYTASNKKSTSELREVDDDRICCKRELSVTPDVVLSQDSVRAGPRSPTQPCRANGEHESARRPNPS